MGKGAEKKVNERGKGPGEYLGRKLQPHLERKRFRSGEIRQLGNRGGG